MGSLPINSIPINSIEKIEIIPGGGATLYGSGTIGGVINIVTNSSVKENNFFTKLKYGSFDDRTLGFAGGYNVGDQLYVNYGFDYSNTQGYRKEELKDITNTLLGFDYRINDNNKIRIQGRSSKDKHIGTSQVSRESLTQDRRAPGLNQDINTTNNSLTATYEYRYNDNLTFSSTIYKQEQERDVEAEDIKTIEIALYAKSTPDVRSLYIFRDVQSFMKANLQDNKEGLKLKTKYNYDNGEVLFGYDYFKGTLKRTSNVTSQTLKTYYNGEVSITLRKPAPFVNQVAINLIKESQSAYVFNKYLLSDNIDFTAGVRAEFTKYSGERLNGPNKYPLSQIPPKIKKISTNKNIDNYAGELGLLYRATDTRSFYTRYERGYVTPFASQLTDKIHDDKVKDTGGWFTPPIVNVSSLYVGNNLKPEITDTVEFGYRDFIGDSFVSSSIFITDTKDEIILINSGVTNPAIKRWKYRNLAKTRRIGLEFQAEQAFDNFSLNQSLTLVQGKNLVKNEDARIEKGDKIPMIPMAKLTFGGKYDFTDNFSILGNYTYTSSKDTLELDEKDNIVQYKIEGYGIIDLGFLYRFDDYSSLRGGVRNLASSKYNLFETSKDTYPAPERNYYVELAIKF